ncbi:MAG: precorrin-6y C5,15-methyltransferase (decarboxylating) subunit CbiE [Hyphomicrobiaceae bacterium]
MALGSERAGPAARPTAGTDASSALPRWLSILGIGEDGPDGLSPAARRLIGEARLVAGGARHLALAAPLITGETLAWPSPMTDGIPPILARRGTPVAVLASGDPFWYGVGATLMRHVAVGETVTVPAASAYQLAAGRLGWPLQSVRTLSVHGRPHEAIVPHLQPGARLLILSWDATSPGRIARLLDERGFGRSRLTVLEALGGPRERIRSTDAASFDLDAIAPLNTIGLEIVAAPGARVIPLSCGLDDALFETDGVMTKREIRALTLSALGPCEGELLWDVGAGSGSVAIEWLLRHPTMRAVAIEPRADRAGLIARNAVALGVPDLKILEGAAPAALQDLATPDAVFVGGGLTVPALVETCLEALRPGGRLLANAVTTGSEAVLLALHARLGGDLLRISVARAEPVGTMTGWRPAMPVTQLRLVKP